MCDSSRLVQIDRNEIVASVKMHEMKRCIKKEYTPSHPPARKIKHFVKFEYAGSVSTNKRTHRCKPIKTKTRRSRRIKWQKLQCNANRLFTLKKCFLDSCCPKTRIQQCKPMLKNKGKPNCLCFVCLLQCHCCRR